MKILLIIIPILIFSFQASSQNLINNKKDTLQKFETFYYSTLKDKTQFRNSLPDGFYVLIFDVGVDINKMNLNINRRNDSPILYQQHNGFYSFEMPSASVINFDFNYTGDLKSTGSFAHLYRVAPNIMGTKTEFSLKTLPGKDFNNEDLTGKITCLLLWRPTAKISRTYFWLLNTFDYKDVQFVALSDVHLSRLKKFNDQHPENQFLFANDKFGKLDKWTEIISGLGVIILITDEDGRLVYKNMITEDHSIFQEQLKKSIDQKLLMLRNE